MTRSIPTQLQCRKTKIYLHQHSCHKFLLALAKTERLNQTTCSNMTRGIPYWPLFFSSSIPFAIVAYCTKVCVSTYHRQIVHSINQNSESNNLRRLLRSHKKIRFINHRYFLAAKISSSLNLHNFTKTLTLFAYIEISLTSQITIEKVIVMRNNLQDQNLVSIWSHLITAWMQTILLFHLAILCISSPQRAKQRKK